LPPPLFINFSFFHLVARITPTFALIPLFFVPFGLITIHDLKHKGIRAWFATNLDVSFDNNLAEQGCATPKIKMKVSGGFRTEKGESARIGSVLSSACKQAKKNMPNVIKYVFSKPNKFALSD
jgi:hypothetical protein